MSFRALILHVLVHARLPTGRLAKGRMAFSVRREIAHDKDCAVVETGSFTGEAHERECPFSLTLPAKRKRSINEGAHITSDVNHPKRDALFGVRRLDAALSGWHSTHDRLAPCSAASPD